jgi:S1-C subfamily serine protease
MTRDSRFQAYLRQDLFRQEHWAALQPDLWRQNGFLGGWVAAKALVGQFDEAWGRMIGLYDRNADWTMTVCSVSTSGGECPKGLEREVDFPTALRQHLEVREYIPARGRPATPPSASTLPAPSAPQIAAMPPVPAVPVPTLPPVPVTPKASTGSAFRIANGQFVTNHHVINGCNALNVEGKPGGRVVASDAIRDLALISVANDSGPVAGIRTTRIQLNESITAAGFPLEGAFSGIAITNGTISRLSGLRGDTGEVQISAPVQQGNSGGPLLDAAGNVVGVVSSKLNALKAAGASGDIPQNVNFAINGSSLRAFLDAKNINYKEVGSEPELTGVQIAARASAFTVLIECRQ